PVRRTGAVTARRAAPTARSSIRYRAVDVRGMHRASCHWLSIQCSGTAYAMVNRQVFYSAEGGVQPRGTDRAPREPGGGRLGTRSGRATFICAAMVGIALVAGPAFAAGSPTLALLPP